MDPTVAVMRPALVLALVHEGIDYETVLESLEDHLCLRHGQRQRPEGMPTLCIWRALEDDREAVLDGCLLELSGSSWFGPEARRYQDGFRTVARMLPLTIAATGVNPVIELRIHSPRALDPVVRLGHSFASAFPEGVCFEELVWRTGMPEGGEAIFRMRLRREPWRVCVECNWHMDHEESGGDALARWEDFGRQAQELSSRLLAALGGV